MELELLKAEFREKFGEEAPFLTKLTMWCLNHEYKNRPDFLELENEIERFEFSQRPHVSEIVPVSSSKNVEPEEEEEKEPEKQPHDDYDINSIRQFGFVYKKGILFFCFVKLSINNIRNNF
jgi:hypothetical protein